MSYNNFQPGGFNPATMTPEQKRLLVQQFQQSKLGQQSGGMPNVGGGMSGMNNMGQMGGTGGFVNPGSMGSMGNMANMGTSSPQLGYNRPPQSNPNQSGASNVHSFASNHFQDLNSFHDRQNAMIAAERLRQQQQRQPSQAFGPTGAVSNSGIVPPLVPNQINNSQNVQNLMNDPQLLARYQAIQALQNRATLNQPAQNQSQSTVPIQATAQFQQSNFANPGNVLQHPHPPPLQSHQSMASGNLSQLQRPNMPIQGFSQPNVNLNMRPGSSDGPRSASPSAFQNALPIAGPSAAANFAPSNQAKGGGSGVKREREPSTDPSASNVSAPQSSTRRLSKAESNHSPSPSQSQSQGPSQNQSQNQSQAASPSSKPPADAASEPKKKRRREDKPRPKKNKDAEDKKDKATPVVHFGGIEPVTKSTPSETFSRGADANPTTPVTAVDREREASKPFARESGRDMERPVVERKRGGGGEGMRGTMRTELAKLMYACGDVSDPKVDTVDYLEDMVVEFIADLARPPPPVRSQPGAPYVQLPTTRQSVRYRLENRPALRKYLARFDVMTVMQVEIDKFRRSDRPTEFDLVENIGSQALGLDVPDSSSTRLVRRGRRGMPRRVGGDGERRKPGPKKGWKEEFRQQGIEPVSKRKLALQNRVAEPKRRYRKSQGREGGSAGVKGENH